MSDEARTYQVKGIHCQSCATKVTNALEPVCGVESVEVDISNDEVRVTGSADAEAVREAIHAAGYEVVGQ